MTEWVVRSEVYLDNEYNTSWILKKKNYPWNQFRVTVVDSEHKFDRLPERNANVTRLTW